MSEREEALKAAERIVRLGDTHSIMAGGELVSRALLSSAKAEAEMLEALKAIVERGTDSPEHRAAEAAISKAQGKQL